MAPLKVVCLISGGKDSLFSILHCIQNDHNVVALANLHPPRLDREEALEDMDSFMYQTVGHRMIPLYGQALGLPLYRQEIAGSAVNQSKSYGQQAADEDETESLTPLLRKVKQRHPGVNAVSTGAILSDYQRTRVESVAVRLGLTPLSYLWQWPNMPPHTQTALLEDMHTAGQDSRIIKVASGGLDSSFLWCNVADPRTMNRIDKAVSRFGSGDDGAVLGEGGEYETLAVAGPAPLWKKRIEVEDEDVKVVEGEAGTASVSITGAKVVQHGSERKFDRVRTPPLLEPRFEALLQQVCQMGSATATLYENGDITSTSSIDHICYQYCLGPPNKPAAEQMDAIMKGAAGILPLQTPPLGLKDIAYVSIILRNMADFATVNAVYSAFFTAPNPPARITLADASALQGGHNVMVSYTCVKGPAEARLGLHVQSQSYWAPANIGPYSQAISVPVSNADEGSKQRIIYVAGQIPLIPASMDLVAPEAASGEMDGFAKQTVLAAQHFVRIGRAIQVKAWACGIAFITAVSAEDASAKARVARLLWEGLHRNIEDHSASDNADGEEYDDDFDVWNVRHGAQRNTSERQSTQGKDTKPTADMAGEAPRLEIVQVETLPRGASIEWATYGLTTAGGSTPRIPHLEHLLEVFHNRIVG